jgi:hypothetical protein
LAGPEFPGGGSGVNSDERTISSMTELDQVTQSPPRLSTRTATVVGFASINLLIYTGLVVWIHGPTGHVRLTLLVTAIVCGVGVVGGLGIAAIKLLRDEQTPLWSYRNEQGRIIHGFFAWWGQCAGLWCLVVVTGYNLIHVVSLAADAVALVG